MNLDPRTSKEYDALIWAHCRDCQGRGKTVYSDCKDDKCKLFTVRNKPRKLSLEFDYSEIAKKIIEIAVEISKKHGTFQMFSVRSKYRAMTGNGNSINYGAITGRKEWKELFIECGEVVAMGERSHGDKVKLWRLKCQLQ